MRWLRDERIIDTDRVVIFDEVIPRIRLLAHDGAGRLRIGLWKGQSLVAGWIVPRLPAGAFLDIEGNVVTGHVNGEARRLHNYVQSYDGGRPESLVIPRGTYRLTLDQDPTLAVDVMVEVSLQAMSA
jgi:hypothetical protein